MRRQDLDAPAVDAVASRPLTVANPGKDPIDLLAMIDRLPHKAYPRRPMSHGALFSPWTRDARLQIAYTPPPDYRIDMKIELLGKAADRTLSLGLPVGGGQAEIVIDKRLSASGRQCRSLETNGRDSGLNHVHGVPLPFGPGADNGQLLLSTRPVQLAEVVGPTSVRMTCDGATVLERDGEPRRLILWVHPECRAIRASNATEVVGFLRGRSPSEPVSRRGSDGASPSRGSATIIDVDSQSRISTRAR